MKFTRRSALMSTLFGASYVGLRALATGIPAALLMKGRNAFADPAACTNNKAKAQYIIFNTSSQGDAINANCPGTYGPNLGGVAHNQNASMQETPITVGGVATTAAAPWATLGTLPGNVLGRTCFWHIMTNTPVHPKEPDVLKLNGAAAGNEMLPSLLAQQLAPCLGTIQSQPITLGASTPSEGLSFSGQALPIVPPLALKATLTNPAGPLTNLQALRDSTLGQLHDLYSTGASRSQRAYIDSLVVSQQQVRGIRQDLLNDLSTITDNSVQSQITAAITLIRMNVTPVIAIHIPFSGDNHTDQGLVTEAAQTVSGVASIGMLMTQLQAANLADQVTFMSLNVFGRTIGAGNTDGRQHNPNHQVSISIGSQFKGGIIGGIGPVAGDYGALDFDSTTGTGGTGGDVRAPDSLGAFAKTMMASVGVDSGLIDNTIAVGKVVSAALA